MPALPARWEGQHHLRREDRRMNFSNSDPRPRWTSARTPPILDAGLRTVSFTSPALLTITLTFCAVLNIPWKDWCWSWNSNTLAIWCKELTHLKRQWCWERLKAGGEGDNRGLDGWMASPTQWTWVSVDSGSWWWTGRPGMLWSMGSQSVGHNWAELTFRAILPPKLTSTAFKQMRKLLLQILTSTFVETNDKSYTLKNTAYLG